MSKQKKSIWDSPLTKSQIKTSEVKMPEMLLGYLIGPFGALLSSGIFTSILQSYFTDVLKLNLSFLTTLQLFSTILIVAANLIVGQLIERTRTKAGKARPWILLSAFTLSVASVLMFIVPFEGTAKMVWVAIAYNLFYSFHTRFTTRQIPHWFRSPRETARNEEHWLPLPTWPVWALWEPVPWYSRFWYPLH